jgi:putative thioredoxin
MIEKAVRAANGSVRLVKINIDENPGVAGQLGVRSIPAVYAFDHGRPIDGFMGAIPESQIKLFVDRLSGADMTAAIPSKRAKS